MRRGMYWTVFSACLACGATALLAYGAGQPPPKERVQTRTAKPVANASEEARVRRALERAGLDPKQEAKALAFMKQYFPDELEGLGRARHEEPREYVGRIRDAFFQARELEEMKKFEPRAYNDRVAYLTKRVRAWRLAVEMKKAQPPRREELRKQLRKLLGEIFDSRQSELEARLHELEQELIDRREEVRLHKLSHYAVIQERLAKFLGDGEPVYW